jgi:hypothetical protein
MRARNMLAVVAVLAAGCAARTPAAKTEAGKPRYYEMRTYTANAGKMEALHQRFRDHANRLLAKHGMEVVGHWTVESGEGAGTTMVFILAYPSKEAREKAWEAFKADPEWQKVKADSEKDGALVGKVVQTFMVPTDYSRLQ